MQNCLQRTRCLHQSGRGCSTAGCSPKSGVSSVRRGWDTDHRATQFSSKTRTTLIPNICRVSWAARLFQAQLLCWESRHLKHAVPPSQLQGWISHIDYYCSLTYPSAKCQLGSQPTLSLPCKVQPWMLLPMAESQCSSTEHRLLLETKAAA